MQFFYGPDKRNHRSFEQFIDCIRTLGVLQGQKVLMYYTPQSGPSINMRYAVRLWEEYTNEVLKK